MQPGHQVSEDKINQLLWKVAEFEEVITKELKAKGRKQCLRWEQDQWWFGAPIVDAQALFWSMVVDGYPPSKPHVGQGYIVHFGRPARPAPLC